MTALLLDVIFSLAISRAFSIPLSKFLDIPPSFLPSECSSNLIPVLGSNQNSVEQNGKEIATLENGKEMRTSELHELSQGQHQVALCVDAFSATYNSAYRYATHPHPLLLESSFITPPIDKQLPY